MTKDLGRGNRLLVSPGYTPFTLLRADDVEFVDVDRLGLSPELAGELAAWAVRFESLEWNPRTQEHLPHEYMARGLGARAQGRPRTGAGAAGLLG